VSKNKFCMSLLLLYRMETLSVVSRHYIVIEVAKKAVSAVRGQLYHVGRIQGLAGCLVAAAAARCSGGRAGQRGAGIVMPLIDRKI
jgi:hypothetical protein